MTDKCRCGSDYDPETGVCNRTGILASHCDAPSRPLPKIFLVSDGSAPWVQGYALAEDGTWLTTHISSSKAFARRDLQTSVKHIAYAAHYPNGYTLVDYTADGGDELEHRADYMGALMRGDASDEIKMREAAA